MRVARTLVGRLQKKAKGLLDGRHNIANVDGTCHSHLFTSFPFNLARSSFSSNTMTVPRSDLTPTSSLPVSSDTH